MHAGRGEILNWKARVDTAAHLVVMATTATANTAEPATGADDPIIGVNEGLDVMAGNRMDVIHDGIAPCIAAGAFGAGVFLTSDSDGKVTPATANGDRVVGYSLEPAGAEDEIVRVMVEIGTYAAPTSA